MQTKAIPQVPRGVEVGVTDLLVRQGAVNPVHVRMAFLCAETIQVSLPFI
jgi:hypothetical protein